MLKDCSKFERYSKIMYTDRQHSFKRLVSKIVYCDGLFKKGIGLMFRSRNAVKDTAWLFRFKRQRKIDVTMIFVFFPIDLVFLDENNSIVELKENLRPFNNYFPKKESCSLMELECGSIKKHHLQRGQKIFFRR
ncbi:MAG: DUF192 domain-containing protein [Candidatus Woesearchaeota archaeon]